MEVCTRTMLLPAGARASAHRCTAIASSRASCSLGAAPVRRVGFGGRHRAALSSRPALPARQPRTLGAPVQARRGGGGAPDVADRVVASLPYLLPLFDGLKYGRFFFMQFPAAGAALVPLEPLIKLYFSVPFASIAAFFAIYLGLVNNQNFSRFVRVSASQAVLLDIILVFPSLLEGILKPPMGGPGLQLYITLSNTIFLFVVACVAYSVGSSLAGRSARLPIVGEAAEAQVR